MTNTKMLNQNWRVFLKAALAGSFGLMAFYFLLLWVITQSISHPWNQFLTYQPWMSLLILGFGIQIGLYWLMRKGIRFSLANKSTAQLATRTSTAVSGTAMVACCAHHVADLVPVLGVSGVALFFTEYQQELLILGVVSNILGILFMLWHLSGKPSFRIIFVQLSTRFQPDSNYLN